MFVVTHHPREPLELEGGTTFSFVTGGIEAALGKARRAALDRDVALGGGAEVARQYPRAGLVDEMLESLVPVLLGAGERLVYAGGTDLRGLELVGAVFAPKVVHPKFSMLTEGATGRAKRWVDRRQSQKGRQPGFPLRFTHNR